MSERPDALRYALAALALVAVIGLSIRVYGQLGELGGANSDLADAARTLGGLRETAAQGLGPPLLDARAGSPTDLLTQQLRRLGFEVRRTTLVAAKPAGRDAVVASFAVEGGADPAALDRLAMWTGANAHSAILQSLGATAAADGKSDVTLEVDAIVRPTGARPS